MTDEELADEIIARLNRLLESYSSDVRKVIADVFGHRCHVPRAMVHHPTIQIRESGVGTTVSALGVLNGVVGVVREGPKAGWGFIAAVYDDDNALVRFERTKET
jgi:hypothetical protein